MYVDAVIPTGVMGETYSYKHLSIGIVQIIPLTSKVGEGKTAVTAEGPNSYLKNPMLQFCLCFFLNYGQTSLSLCLNEAVALLAVALLNPSLCLTYRY